MIINPTREIQARLKELGYDPGPVDGAMGPLTRAAIARFQKDKSLPIVHPGAYGSITAKALFGDHPPPVVPPWYAELLRRKGLHETTNKSVLSAWLKSGGGTVGDPSKIPWCGDAVETPIAITLPDEPRPTNPFLAANWSKFGVPLERPAVGAIMSLWRGKPTSIFGHVGLLSAWNNTHFELLGGNQSNAITHAWFPWDRLRKNGMRWPSTYPLPGSSPVVVAETGDLSTTEA